MKTHFLLLINSTIKFKTISTISLDFKTLRIGKEKKMKNIEIYQQTGRTVQYKKMHSAV